MLVLLFIQFGQLHSFWLLYSLYTCPVGWSCRIHQLYLGGGVRTMSVLDIQLCVNKNYTSCLNFWDETCWFLLLRFFGLLSSSLLLFPQCFGRYVLRPSSGVCRTREGSRVRQTPEEGRRTYWPKRCGNNNKDKDNSPKNLYDKKNYTYTKLNCLN